MPLQATSGAASYDAFGGGGGVPVVPNYIEDVFSTYLYTGTGASQTITNGIDLSTKGGLVWTKTRNQAVSHNLVNTISGNTKYLLSNSLTGQQTTSPADNITAFNTTGYSLGADTATNQVNLSGNTYVSWTLRKQPKFFDIQTWTGTGSNTTIAHNLGSVPGSIFVKCTSPYGDWAVYHRSLANTQYLKLNDTAAAATGATWWNSTTPTASVFSVGTSADVNGSGNTYIAYIFAHDAGGFGLTGTDNVISCGSFTTDGSGNATVSLGYEPQWIVRKASSTGDNWHILDTMRGWVNNTTAGASKELVANSSGAEGGLTGDLIPTATGFTTSASSSLDPSTTFIYIAIRRGPMKVPTSGTSVFLPTTYTGNGSTQTITTNFPVDFSLFINRTKSSFDNNNVFDRLRGGTRYLATNVTDSESSLGSAIAPLYDSNTGVNLQAATITNGSSASIIVENFKRAPSFFDEVCYIGTGYAAVQNVTHNLTVVPEMMIVKARSYAGDSWIVYVSALGNTQYLQLNATSAPSTASLWDNTTPTASVFTVGNNTATNNSGATYIACLFATCAGVSKVGSYTGTATTKQIDCGFTAGARFVLIKRTDSTGDWYVWDTARGIVSGNDPYLLLNSTAAEVTNTDYIDTYSAGFEISSTAPAAINASGGTYIFLAIA